MKKFIVAVVVVVITMVIVLGFVEVDDSQEVKTGEGIVYSLSVINTELEKVTDLSKKDQDIICATSRGLLTLDKEGEIQPSLATEVQVRDEGIEYEFILSDEYYWSNGEKITPEDVRDFLKELIKYEDEENIEALLDVYGARAFRNGEGTFERGVAITTGSNSIKIRLNKKNDNLINDFTKPQYRLRKLIPLWGTLETTYNDINYSGDYKISYIDENTMTLAINKNIEGPKEITFAKDVSEELAMAAYEVGKRDMVENPPNSVLGRLEEENKLLTFNAGEGYYLSLNTALDGFSLGTRRYIYKNIYLATEEFMDLYPQRIESSEGSYFIEDKEDLTKLQTRKVSVNGGEAVDKLEYITLLAVDNDESRDLCKYLVKYFKDNLALNLRYSLVKEEDFKDEDLIRRYNLLLVNIDGESNDKKGFYNKVKKYLREEERSKLEENLMAEEVNYTSIEEGFFDNCSFVPIMFGKVNVAISSKVKDVKVDGHGNTIFSK